MAQDDPAAAWVLPVLLLYGCFFSNRPADAAEPMSSREAAVIAAVGAAWGGTLVLAAAACRFLLDLDDLGTVLTAYSVVVLAEAYAAGALLTKRLVAGDSRATLDLMHPISTLEPGR